MNFGFRRQPPPSKTPPETPRGAPATPARAVRTTEKAKPAATTGPLAPRPAADTGALIPRPAGTGRSPSVGALVPTSGGSSPSAYYGPDGRPTPFPEARLLTAPGAVLAQEQATREMLALYEGGPLLVVRQSVSSALVHTFIQTARAQGIAVRINEAHLVERAVIAIAYQLDASRGEIINDPSRNAKMQERFADIIRRAADCRTTDLYFEVNQAKATVDILIGKTIIHAFDDLTPADGVAMLGAAFSMADKGGSDPQYQPMRHQQVRITNRDGRFGPAVQTLRLQYNPTVGGGRNLVVRILYRSNGATAAEADLGGLGYTPDQERAIALMRTRSYGVNLIAGPTGSGKSTTLHRNLNALSRERENQVKIFTLEDPVEYMLDDGVQIPIYGAQDEEDKTKKFQEGLSAILRSKPNVIMLQEIRSHGTASIVVQAAMTGHQVWTTIHANDAMSIIDRLRDIGIEDYKITDPAIISGLVCQRLIARLCQHCKVPITSASLRRDADRFFLERLKIALPEDWTSLMVRNADGCAHCTRGREGLELVAEVIVPDQAFMDLVAKGDKKGAREHWLSALKGTTMMDHALMKVRQGLCDPRDVEVELGPFTTVY